MNGKPLHFDVTIAAVLSGVAATAIAWLWLASAVGRAWFMLFVLWCYGGETPTARVVLNHGTAFATALACGVATACVVAALCHLFRPGERNPDHVKYDILRDDR